MQYGAVQKNVDERKTSGTSPEQRILLGYNFDKAQSMEGDRNEKKIYDHKMDAMDVVFLFPISRIQLEEYIRIEKYYKLLGSIQEFDSLIRCDGKWATFFLGGQKEFCSKKIGNLEAVPRLESFWSRVGDLPLSPSSIKGLSGTKTSPELSEPYFSQTWARCRRVVRDQAWVRSLYTSVPVFSPAGSEFKFHNSPLKDQMQVTFRVESDEQKTKWLENLFPRGVSRRCRPWDEVNHACQYRYGVPLWPHPNVFLFGRYAEWVETAIKVPEVRYELMITTKKVEALEPTVIMAEIAPFFEEGNSHILLIPKHLELGPLERMFYDVRALCDEGDVKTVALSSPELPKQDVWFHLKGETYRMFYQPRDFRASEPIGKIKSKISVLYGLDGKTASQWMDIYYHPSIWGLREEGEYLRVYFYGEVLDFRDYAPFYFALDKSTSKMPRWIVVCSEEQWNPGISSWEGSNVFW